MQATLEQAVAFIKAGDTEKGKQLLVELIKQNPRDEKAWLWMTRCVATIEQKKYCFDRVLQINPQNQYAIEGLRRLNNPFPVNPPTQPKAKVVPQQPAHHRKPKNSNALIILLTVVGLSGLVCVCVIARWFFYSSNTADLNQPARPTKITRPNYRQMLEANGFAYSMSDGDGDPIYVSPCGCVATVKPDYVGFAAYYNPNDTCAIEHLGIIVRIMYPAEVIDFIVANMNEVIAKDMTVHGTAAGYDINIDFDPYDPKLIMTIEDPQ